MQRLAPQGYWPVHAAKGVRGLFPSGSRQLLKAGSRSRLSFSPLNGWVASESGAFLMAGPAVGNRPPFARAPVSLPIRHRDELVCATGLLVRRVDGSPIAAHAANRKRTLTMAAAHSGLTTVIAS